MNDRPEYDIVANLKQWLKPWLNLGEYIDPAILAEEIEHQEYLKYTQETGGDAK